MAARKDLYKTKLYMTWLRMRGRCNNPRKHNYKYYGGRGVIVCQRWDSFQYFADDVGEPPTPKHTLERKDGKGNYEPGNVVWATMEDQNRNKPEYNKLDMNLADEIRHDYASGVYTQKQLAKIYNVTQANISSVVLGKTWRK